MAKLTLSDVSNLLGNPTSAANTINANNALIEGEFENTLSRDGSTPNQMLADIDMNGQDLLNVGAIDTQTLVVHGQPVPDLSEVLLQSNNLSDLTNPTAARGNLGLGNVDNTSDDEKPVSAAQQTALDGKANVVHTHVMASITDLAPAMALKEDKSNKGVSNGYASLGPDGKVPGSQLPADGTYLGAWNASTNNPTINSGIGTNGDFYIVSVAGSTEIDGINTWTVGDQVRFNGTSWQRIPSSNSVQSVAGKTGIVVLDVDDVSGLQTALDGKQAALGFSPVNKAGDTMTGPLNFRRSVDTAPNDINLQEADGSNRWTVRHRADNDSTDPNGFSIIRRDASGAAVDQPFKIASDGTIRIGGDVGSAGVELGKEATFTTALGGFKFIKCIGLAAGTNLNTVLDAGVYDVSSPAAGTAPYDSPDWWYLEVIRHSNDNQWVKQVATLLTGPGGVKPVVWVRFRKGGAWSSWHPVSGFVTPADFGGTGVRNASAAVTDDQWPLQRWMDSDLPKVLDAWYATSAGIARGLAFGSQAGFQIFGMGAQSGIRLDNAGSIRVYGADLPNPMGPAPDTVALKDFNILLSGNFAQIPLSIEFADGDSGSGMPGIDMQNVHFIPSDANAGVTDAMLKLLNVRQGHLRNVSGFGRYGAYAGNFIKCSAGPSSAPVELKFDNCRASHFQRGFQVEAASGAVANDDMQGIHFDTCVAIAVDRGFDLNGGPEGFGEWSTITNCHAYFRELGVIGTNYGNVRVKDGYWLGHGNLGTIQGVALTGSSIEPRCWVDNNRIRLDAASGGTRIGLNLANTLSGRATGNHTTNATNAYGLVAGSWTQSGNT